MSIDIKDFYLGTPMSDYEYMRIHRDNIPQAIIDFYHLDDNYFDSNGNAYVEIRKGMYGLKQAGKIANDRLTKFLAPHGFTPAPTTPGLWLDNQSDLAFTLVVDDFGVKYTSRDDAERLSTVLKRQYEIKEDWTGDRYCGLQLDWDYDKRTCDISMPGYVERALQRFNHPKPTRQQHAPHAWQKPKYGAKTQYATLPDNSEPLQSIDTKYVQEVLGTLLYYARAVDCTMLTAIGSIATQQAKPTKKTMDAIKQLLNYAATHPNAVVRYHASDMILFVDSDGSYLSESKARSRAAGYHYLSSIPTDPNAEPPHNGAVNILCQILREVCSSAAEAELAATFHNGKEACPIRHMLEALGHPQPPTPIITDNSTAVGIATDTIKQKRSKAIDMRFYWIRDRARQGQFVIRWKKGALNKADYFSKHHPGTHHQAIRSTYLHSPDNPARNYFECLQDADDRNSDPDASVPAANAVITASSGEGVLMSDRYSGEQPGVSHIDTVTGSGEFRSQAEEIRSPELPELRSPISLFT